MEISQEILHTLLSYNPESGEFIWIAPNDRMRKNGAIAGYIDAKGYRKIKIGGRCYYAHRLAWMYVFGKFPDGILDHRNADPSDNRISNLRKATYGENVANSSLKRSVPGYRGVRKNTRGKLWSASIMKDGRNYFLGNHETKEAAALAYKTAAKKFFGEFARVD